MSTRRSFARVTIAGIGAATTIAAVRWASTPRGRRTLGRLMRRTRARMRHLAGRSQGLRYRVTGRHPSPDVSDDVLVQRVRSRLGPLTRRLDVPHLHVESHDHHVTLRGVVATDDDVRMIDEFVRAIPGVADVAHELVVGLGPADQRPSQGRAEQRSPMRHELHVAATERGIADDLHEAAVGAALTTFLALLPEGERDHVRTHLPADVRALADDAAVTSDHEVVDESSLFAAVAAAAGSAFTSGADELTRDILAIMRRRIPEEAGDIAAVLPGGLKGLWADPHAHHHV